MKKAPRQRRPRSGRVQRLEDRLAMSADPWLGSLADSGGGSPTPPGFAPPPAAVSSVAVPPVVEFQLESAHQASGLAEVMARYGFRGGGQTVAVIDSGIAWAHPSLGGGLGAGQKVVGGYDFGDNDSDPHDTHGHGTHVAGIIASDHPQHAGVAPDASLVGLKVSDSAGVIGYTEIEEALRWVLDSLDSGSLVDPITAVNISLGVPQNEEAPTAYTRFEDELAALEAAGVFVAVSTGNYFGSEYNTPGMMYPANSPHVVPVMSAYDSGALASYSQRHERAIAAPGTWIVSTVIDGQGNQNGAADNGDFGYKSGTSMAAPYVAGASVLIREAMEFVGYAGVTQQTIYDHMVATAETLYDSATETHYSRLDLAAAIDALMPADDYGSSSWAAHDLGVLGVAGAPAAVSGVISTLDDVDYFRFTAASTGTATFHAAGLTHGLQAAWEADGASGTLSDDGLTFTLDVTAGQEYAVGVSTLDGLGYYELDVSVDASFAYTDWGAVAGQVTHAGIDAGGGYYKLSAGAAGLLTIDTPAGSEGVLLTLYDSNLEQLAVSGTGGRIDAPVAAGGEHFLRVTGGDRVDVRLTNLVSVSGETVSVSGTPGDDAFSFAASYATPTLSINGIDYSFDAATHSRFLFDGGAGADSADLTGAGRDDHADLGPGGGAMTNGGYTVTVSGVEAITARGGGGNDRAFLRDSAGNDRYTARQGHAVMEGGGYRVTVVGFAKTYAYATGGHDWAVLNDSDGADTYVGFDGRATMYNGHYRNDAYGFDRSVAYSTSGADRAFFVDSAGNDSYLGWSDRAAMYGAGFRNDAYGFARSFAIAGAGGWDRAVFYDTAGDDLYSAGSHRVSFAGQGFAHYVDAFARTTAISTGGDDRAEFRDSVANDAYVAWGHGAVMYGDGFRNEAYGFAQTEASSTAGYDRAWFFDTAGDDTLEARSDRVRLFGAGYDNTARGFDQAFAQASVGHDEAHLYGSSGDDELTGSGGTAQLRGTSYWNTAAGFASVIAYGSDGDDTYAVEAADYAFSQIGVWL